MTIALLTVFHPDDRVTTVAAVLLLPAMIYGVQRHRQVAAPKSAALQSQAAG